MMSKMRRNFCFTLIAIYIFLIGANSDEVVSPAPTQNATTAATTTVATTTTTVKPKVNVTASELCKKCDCDVKNKKLDCSFKLSDWFSNEEWQTLQNGDILFETINLEHNNLTHIPELPAYPVQNLFLAFNQISNITNAAFLNLTELRKLDLSHNKLTTKILNPDVFRGSYVPNAYLPLKNLKTLNLGYNDLHNLDGNLFEHTPNIEELILCKNIFHVIDSLTEIAISGLNSLKVLDISYMELEELPDDFLHGPRELETLILTGNLFDEIPDAIELAPNLKMLVLDENIIEEISGENIFPKMTNLEYLSISYMPKLKKIGKGAFSNLQNLTTFLAADNGNLVYIDPYAFALNNTKSEYLDYPPLEKIYLNNNKLEMLPRDLIIRWDKLHTLDLRYNPWICNCTNDWLINTMIERVNETSPVLTKNVDCETPKEYKDKPLINLNAEKLVVCSEELPGRGGLILIGLLVGLLIGIPLTISGFILYKRGCFGIFNRGNNAAKRGLYDRASFTEDFHI